MDTHDLNKRVAQALGYHVGDGSWMGKVDAQGAIIPLSWEPLPDYANDLNAAIGLVEPLGNIFKLCQCDPAEWGAKWEACITVDPGRNESYITAYADNPAQAICEAWVGFIHAEELEDE